MSRPLIQTLLKSIKPRTARLFFLSWACVFLFGAINAHAVCQCPHTLMDPVETMESDCCCCGEEETAPNSQTTCLCQNQLEAIPSDKTFVEVQLAITDVSWTHTLKRVSPDTPLPDRVFLLPRLEHMNVVKTTVIRI